MADSDEEDFEFSEDEEDESSDAIATSHRAALAEFYKIPRPAAEDEAPIDAPGFDAEHGDVDSQAEFEATLATAGGDRTGFDFGSTCDAFLPTSSASAASAALAESKSAL